MNEDRTAGGAGGRSPLGGERYGVGRGGRPRGGGRGWCHGGPNPERLSGGPGRRRGCAGSPWDVVERLERRVEELEARLAGND